MESNGTNGGVTKSAAEVVGKSGDVDRDGEILDSQADIGMARQLLDYEPAVNFAEGLGRTFAWYQECQAKALAKSKTEN